MSQFDFPRINFHGSVLLDVPTGNNGKFEPLRIYDQDAALPYCPPRVYLTPDQIAPVKALDKNYTIISDESGDYVEIETITTDLFDAWAICTLGTSPSDNKYNDLYSIIPLVDDPSTMLNGGTVQPGYWNYFGDLSVFAEAIRITGVQVPDGTGKVITYTPENATGCPPGLAQLLGQSFSFHLQFFEENSRTTAMFCDIDSINDTCTQMFYSKAGIYGKPNGVEKTYFTGKPCKSTFNWLSLCKMLNFNNPLLSPMSGATYFNSTIDLNSDDTDVQFQTDLNQVAGFDVKALSMKILLHQVYEVRNPDYSKMPTAPLGNNRTSVPKNPARVAFSGSLCPFKPESDMRTNNVARILKNEIKDNLTIDVSQLESPIPLGSNQPLVLGNKLQLSPSFVWVNPAQKVISLDVINTICEYGIGLKEYSKYGGPTSIPPFTGYENFDFGTLSLVFAPDDGSKSTKIGSFDHTNDYNMETFLARGGVMDFPIPPNLDFAKGIFQVYIGSALLLQEDDYLILSDQQGSYAEQYQTPSYGYKSDGAGRGPVLLRVFHRGVPIPKSAPVKGVFQFQGSSAVQTTPFSFYDGVEFDYPTFNPGCVQYVFSINENQKMPTQPSQGLYFAANGYTVSTRVLAEAKELEVYLNGTEPLTWEVIYNKILINYNNVLPIMNAILPFKKKVWRDSYTMQRMLLLTDESNWGEAMYMPVTRELSKNQQALLRMWANQNLNNPS